MAWGVWQRKIRWGAPTAFLAAIGFLLVTVGACSMVRAGEAPANADDLHQKELERLRDFLAGPNRTFATRRDAAAGLLEKDSDDARTILVEVLAAPSEAARAVLEEIASRDSASETFIDPMFQLLRSEDEAVRRTAAQAFGAYQGNEKVLAGLKDLATDAKAPVPVRLSAVEALSQIVDPRAVASLVEVASAATGDVATAAARALVDMTGLAEFGTSSEQWAAWWKRHKDEPETSFLRGLLRRFRAELRRRDAALASTEDRLSRLLNEIYEVADAKQKGNLIQSHLEDGLPQVRLVAGRQATALAREVVGANNGGRQAYQPLIQLLLKHVADEVPAVRAACVDALAAWQETAAGPVLLARLETEKSPEVRAALAAALGALKTGEAIPRLIVMLESASPAEVVKAAGALGALGDRSTLGAAAVDVALEPLGRLARTSPDAGVREAACRALAKIAHPSAEQVLVEALGDQAAGVRFSAAQGLGNLGKVGPGTVEALGAHLQDDNKGVRQAVAAALAKLGGPDAARKMADRLKPGAETEPAVRSALWTAIQGLAQQGDLPDFAQELGDRFFSLEGAEAMQRAAALYEIAQSKYPASEAGSQKLRALLERLVDAYVAAGMLEKAAPVLRQLLADTPSENRERRQELQQQLGLILLEKGPYGEAGQVLARTIEALEPANRGPLVKTVLARAEILLRTDKPEQALELIDAFKAARTNWPAAEQAEAFDQLQGEAVKAAVARAIVNLSGSEEQVQAAVAALKKIGLPAAGGLLEALESAAREGRAPAEAKILSALEAATGRTDHGYDPAATLENRLKAIANWRKTLAAPSTGKNSPEAGARPPETQPPPGKTP